MRYKCKALCERHRWGLTAKRQNEAVIQRQAVCVLNYSQYFSPAYLQCFSALLLSETLPCEDVNLTQPQISVIGNKYNAHAHTHAHTHTHTHTENPWWLH